MKYIYVLIFFFVFSFGFSQNIDTCEVFVIINKKNTNIRYVKYKGVHTMVELKNGRRFPSAEWLNFTETKLHITKGFNGINMPYVGDTIINIGDIKWIFWDGTPRKRLKSSKYYFRIEKIYTNCEYKGWNHLYFKNEMEF